MHEVVGIMTGAVVHDIEHKDATDKLPEIDPKESEAPQQQGGAPTACFEAPTPSAPTRPDASCPSTWGPRTTRAPTRPCS